MKATFTFCFALLLCSCVSGRIKKVPLAKQIIEVEHAHRSTEDSPQTDIAATRDYLRSEPKTESPNDLAPFEEYKVESPKATEYHDDEPTDLEKVRVALETEHLAKKSLNEGISSLTLSILSIILPFILLASIICFILGVAHYTRANKARFSTPNAERKLRNAKGLLIASGVIIGLFVLALFIILSIVLL